MKEFFKRLIVRITAAEMLAFVVGALYCCGVASLLLHASVNLHGEPFDYSGFKPLVVGLMFAIYLLIPLLAYGSVRMMYRMASDFWIRTVAAILMLLLLSFAVPMSLHGFFPFTRVGFTSEISKVQYCWLVCTRFWRIVYFAQVRSVLCFVFSVYVAEVIYFRRGVILSLLRALQLNEIPRWCGLVFVFISVLSCISPFVTDVFSNISQGAYGAAPRGVLLTVRNPSKSFMKGYDGYWKAGEEFTAPVVVMAENADAMVVLTIRALNDLADGYPDSSVVTTQTRIRKDDIVDLVPILYHAYYEGGRLIHKADINNDIVRRCDAELSVQVDQAENCTNTVYAIISESSCTPTLKWTIDGACSSCQKAVSLVETSMGCTNIILRTVFPDIEWQGLFMMKEFMDLFVDKGPGVWIEIFDMPQLPEGLVYRSAVLNITCNMYACMAVKFDCIYDRVRKRFVFVPRRNDGWNLRQQQNLETQSRQRGSESGIRPSSPATPPSSSSSGS